MSDDRNEKGGLGRREFLTGLLAAGASATLPGCEKSEAPPPIPERKIEHATRTDMIDALRASRAQFIDADGKPVNLNALQATLSGNPSTISFMFSACGDVCPITGTVLQTLSQTKPRMKHVIVSVDPLGDFNNRKLANLMEAQGLKVSGPQANTIILFQHPMEEHRPIPLWEALARHWMCNTHSSYGPTGVMSLAIVALSRCLALPAHNWCKQPIIARRSR